MNAVEFDAQINEIYNTWTGAPRAYMEIELPNGSGFLRIVYNTYTLGIECASDDTADYEAKLCDEMFKRFTQNLSQYEQEEGTATLIWRRATYYEAAPVLERRDPGEDKESVLAEGEYISFDDGWIVRPTGRTSHKLSVRCYCPRIDPRFITPEGQPCEMLQAYCVHRGRTEG